MKIRVGQRKPIRDEVRKVSVIIGGKEATELRTQVLEVSEVWRLKSVNPAGVSANTT